MEGRVEICDHGRVGDEEAGIETPGAGLPEYHRVLFASRHSRSRDHRVSG